MTNRFEFSLKHCTLFLLNDRCSDPMKDYTLDIDIKQMWKDPRLAWKHDIFNKSIRVQDIDFVNNIWTPDTFFPNEKRAKLHNSPVNNSFTVLRTNGRITTFQRITITAACPMNLHLFPFDTQLCTLEVESYGYSTEDIKLHWHDDVHSPVKIDEHLRLPTFTMDDMIVEETDQILSTGDSEMKMHLSGNYSRLSCKFKFVRSILYYYVQIYQPSIFVVATSWVSFWIDRESAPARVTLCITAILTMTTLISLTNEQMPKVGYAKAVDVYLVVCYFMVFGALLEYALISYLLIEEKATKQKHRILPLLEKVDNLAAGIYYNSQDSLGRIANNLRKRKITVTSNDDALPTKKMSAANHNDNEHDEAIVFSAPSDRFRSSDVDKYARTMFPVIFLLFNLLYWLLFINLRS